MFNGNNPFSHTVYDFLIVSCHNNSRSRIIDFLENFHDFHTGFRIQVSGRFVRNYKTWTVDYGTGNSNPLLFPTGQFVGSDEYGDEYLVGVDVIEGEDEDEQVLSDIKYVYDAEAKTLTQLTAFVAENDGPADEMEQVAPWGYWLYSRFFDGEPIVLDPVVAPEGLETEAYSFQATVSKETEDEDGETVLESVSYVKEVNVGFDGNDLYIQGISEDYPEGWVKATKNEAGQYVIPANQ